MPRVISHADVENASGTIVVDAETIVTPLAEQLARRRGIQIMIGHDDDTRTTSTEAELVRRVAGRVIDEVGNMDERVLETIVAEVLAAYQSEGTTSPIAAGGPDYCAMCLEQDRRKKRSRAVLTVTGKNTKGIVASVTQRIAELGGDILDISQTLVGDFFTMIIIVDVLSLDVAFADFKAKVEDDVEKIGLHAMMIHEDVMESLHRV